jgi:hypothetical protein
MPDHLDPGPDLQDRPAPTHQDRPYDEADLEARYSGRTLGLRRKPGPPPVPVQAVIGLAAFCAVYGFLIGRAESRRNSPAGHATRGQLDAVAARLDQLHRDYESHLRFAHHPQENPR